MIARHPDRLRPTVLAAGRQVDALIALCRQHRPRHAVIAAADLYPALRDGLRAAGLDTQAHAGADALEALVAGDACDTVVAAIVGAAGLPSTLAAARAGKRLLLANKESVVLAGRLLVDAVAAGGATLLPIDSEHNAIFQCLPTADARTDGSDTATRATPAGLKRIVLTASGGPFRGRSRDSLRAVTPEQAVAHPKWSMGPKISVDSATLMNKGLEVIEASHLFGVDAAAIEVVVHPQSIVHSLVDYVDGSVLAQMGNPDMRTAIAYGLAWPERIDAGVAPLDLAALARLDFEAPDHAAFPCLGLAFDALRAGGSAPAVLNAANEVAVEAFLAGRLPFLGISALIERTLGALPAEPAADLDVLLACDAAARRTAGELLAGMA